MVNGKVVLLLLVAAGGAVVLVASKAKAKKSEALPSATKPGAAPVVVAPPLAGVETDDPTTGVVIVPDDDSEPEENEQPVIVAPAPVAPPPVLTFPLPQAPPFVPAPPGSVPPPPPPPPVSDAQATVPGVPLLVPDILQQGADIMTQAGIPVAVPPVFETTSEPAPAPAPAPTPADILQQGADILTQAGIPVVVPPLVVTPAAEQPTVLEDDTARVLDSMLDIESTAKWKRVEEALKPWQKKRSLVVDGRYGPKSALRMAAETGLLPIVRFWPSGSQPGSAVPKFQADLLAIAATAEEPRASQLRQAADREQGQGFGSKQTAIHPLIAFDVPA